MSSEQEQTKSKTTNKSRAVKRVGIIDTESGEVLDEGTTIYVPPKMRIKGFFMANQIGFETLAKSGLNCEGFRVLMLMMSRMDYENAISISQKEIAEALTMKKQNVSRAIKSLRTAGVFENEANHVVYLATELGWKGKVKNLHKRNAELFREERKQSFKDEERWKAMDAKIAALPKLAA